VISSKARTAAQNASNYCGQPSCTSASPNNFCRSFLWPRHWPTLRPLSTHPLVADEAAAAQ
jgi:hypothetical protein